MGSHGVQGVVMPDRPVVTASYRWTLSEFLDAHSMHNDLFVKPKMKVLGFIDIRVFAVFVGCISITRLAIDISEGVVFAAFHLLLSFLIVLAGLLLALPWLQKRALKRHFQQRPDRHKVVQYRIDSEGVTSTMEGIATGTNRWAAYAKIVRTSKGYLFYPNERIFYWLPNHAFANDDDADVLANMARQYALKYIEQL